MKKDTKTKLQALSLPDLTSKLKEAQIELAKHTVEAAGGKIKNLRLSSTLRRNIAIINAYLNQKQESTKGD